MRKEKNKRGKNPRLDIIQRERVPMKKPVYVLNTLSGFEDNPDGGKTVIIKHRRQALLDRPCHP